MKISLILKGFLVLLINMIVYSCTCSVENKINDNIFSQVKWDSISRSSFEFSHTSEICSYDILPISLGYRGQLTIKFPAFVNKDICYSLEEDKKTLTKRSDFECLPDDSQNTYIVEQKSLKYLHIINTLNFADGPCSTSKSNQKTYFVSGKLKRFCEQESESPIEIDLSNFLDSGGVLTISKHGSICRMNKWLLDIEYTSSINLKIKSNSTLLALKLLNKGNNEFMTFSKSYETDGNYIESLEKGIYEIIVENTDYENTFMESEIQYELLIQLNAKKCYDPPSKKLKLNEHKSDNVCEKRTWIINIEEQGILNIDIPESELLGLHYVLSPDNSQNFFENLQDMNLRKGRYNLIITNLNNQNLQFEDINKSYKLITSFKPLPKKSENTEHEVSVDRNEVEQSFERLMMKNWIKKTKPHPAKTKNDNNIGVIEETVSIQKKLINGDRNIFSFEPYLNGIVVINIRNNQNKSFAYALYNTLLEAYDNLNPIKKKLDVDKSEGQYHVDTGKVYFLRIDFKKDVKEKEIDFLIEYTRR